MSSWRYHLDRFRLHLSAVSSIGQTSTSTLGKYFVDRAQPVVHSLRRKTLKRADAVTVESQAPDLIHPNVVVIRPGIDIDQFRPRQAGEPKAGRVIGVGRLLPRKGFDVLIRAIARVSRWVPSVHLLLVGSGPEESSLRALVRQLEIDGSVTFVSRSSRPELVNLLQSAEVFCHPARWESFFPAAPLEAMACGLPA